jgi:ATP-dependent helicase/nuclease subunit B
MTRDALRVYTIAPGGNFLNVLAQDILAGFPLGHAHRKAYPLSTWTILLPTRRAVRALKSIFISASKNNALLLPQIKPIGDLDEDDNLGKFADIPNAISQTGQMFQLLNLLRQWAKENPQLPIADQIQKSPFQSLNFAKSLLDLVTQIETEEVKLDQLASAYDWDLSDHRNAILSLLGLIKTELPKLLMAENVLNPAARRSILIRAEAQRIESQSLRGPLIAAGSTGTIPATRALLRAISNNPLGAVVLPGLDLSVEDADWDLIGPDHPQFTLKALITELQVERSDIAELSPGRASRNFLSSELMRSSATAEKWHVILKEKSSGVAEAIQNLELIAAPNRHIEARAIALILRNALETPHQTAALVTPDRDLAKRVKNELRRWDIDIDDSAGEPLVHFGLAALAECLLNAVITGLESADLLSILSNSNSNLDLEKEDYRSCVQNLELAVLRTYSSGKGLNALRKSWNNALAKRSTKARTHASVAALSDVDWDNLQSFVTRINNALEPLFSESSRTCENFMKVFEDCINTFAPNADWQTDANQQFATLLSELHAEVNRVPPDTAKNFAPLILSLLQGQTLRQVRPVHPRLSLFGVLEARAIPCDIMILGALNETRWPAQTDSGPWLNRSLRMVLGLQQPERDIGISAHDFTQALGYQKVYLTWSQRLDGAPQLPSRWILRLKAVVETAMGKDINLQNQDWIALAQNLDRPLKLTPRKMPEPRPAVQVRPIRFSVTEIERLVRDPYSVYAKRILKLEPFMPLAKMPDAALRGTLFHEALSIWNKSQKRNLGTDSLIAAGEIIFGPYMHDLEIANFWWPRFQSIAKWLVNEEAEFKIDQAEIFAEVEGQIELDCNGVSHSLTARADRIERLTDGRFRVIDYKSGKPPTLKEVMSGISPQLPLEVAILESGGFKTFGAGLTSAMYYLHITGSQPPGTKLQLDPEPSFTVSTLAQNHLTSLKSLLSKYQVAAQAYLPRAALQKEDDETDYDNLSRYQEWLLANDT